MEIPLDGANTVDSKEGCNRLGDLNCSGPKLEETASHSSITTFLSSEMFGKKRKYSYFSHIP